MNTNRRHLVAILLSAVFTATAGFGAQADPEAIPNACAGGAFASKPSQRYPVLYPVYEYAADGSISCESVGEIQVTAIRELMSAIDTLDLDPHVLAFDLKFCLSAECSSHVEGLFGPAGCLVNVVQGDTANVNLPDRLTKVGAAAALDSDCWT